MYAFISYYILLTNEEIIKFETDDSVSKISKQMA
jgi:hypothetical protein